MPSDGAADVEIEAREALLEACDALADVMASGVEFNDHRIGYVVMQIDRDTLEAVEAAIIRGRAALAASRSEAQRSDAP